MSEKQLDRLRILVLVDDTASYENHLLGQHGISLLLDAASGKTSRRILVDVGQDYATLRHNMNALGVDPRTVDTVVLTHCHYDHSGGLASLLADIGKKDVPVVAHPATFRLNFTTEPYLKHVGVTQEDSATEIASNGGRLFLTRDPLQLMPGLSTTGEVPRVTDCEEVGLRVFTIEDGRTQQDDMVDDTSLVADVKGRGLVVVTGCSHAGIVNIVKHAMKLFPQVPLDGIAGGFHLLSAGEERISRTVTDLAKLAPRWISAGHCTGFKAQVALSEKLGDRFAPLKSGSEYVVPEP